MSNYISVLLMRGPADGYYVSADIERPELLIEYYPPCDGYASISHPDSKPAARRPSRLVYDREYVSAGSDLHVRYVYRGVQHAGA